MSGATGVEFDVDGVGRFVSRPRTIGLEIKILREWHKQLGMPSADASEELSSVATVYSVLSTLLDEVPDGWSLDKAPLSECYAVFAALRSAEDTFPGAVPGGGKG